MVGVRSKLDVSGVCITTCELWAVGTVSDISEGNKALVTDGNARTGALSMTQSASVVRITSARRVGEGVHSKHGLHSSSFSRR